jgi:hypothetical protein
MRTKTLLIAAAALAAGILASSAQTYSQNIVGYINYVSTTVTPQYEMIDNPLDNGTNTLTSIFPTPPGGTKIQLWQPGSGTFMSIGFSGGHWKTNGITVDNSITIPPGVGFFIQIGGTGIYTNTFVGTVVPNTGLNATNAVNTGFQAVSSSLPMSDNITNTATINLITPGGTQIQRWSTASQTFVPVGFSGGKWKTGGVATNVVLNLPEGFFIQNNSGAPINWVQTGP